MNATNGQDYLAGPEPQLAHSPPRAPSMSSTCAWIQGTTDIYYTRMGWPLDWAIWEQTVRDIHDAAHSREVHGVQDTLHLELR